MEKFLKAAVVALLVLGLALASSATPARADSEGAATVTASALNLRSEASTEASVVACVPRGTTVLVTGTDNDWYQVTYQGSSGYMLSDYLAFSSTADAALGTGSILGTNVRVRSGPGTAYDILGTENTGTALAVTGVSSDWLKVSYNGADGYVKSTYMDLSAGGTASGAASAPASAAVSVTEASGTGTINATNVRLRSEPSTSSTILATYSAGKTLTVTGESGDWYRVSGDGQEGFVYKTYLTLGGAVSAVSVTDSADTDAWVISAVHMRSGPDTSYTSRRVLSAGTAVTITGSTEKWYRVRYDGDEGYVFKTYLTTQRADSGAVASEGERIVAEAKKYLGVPYVYGGTSPSGFDCSGFVYYVYRQCGYSITRTATTQNGDGRQVSRSELQPGDIIIFYNGAISGIGHSGIYIGNGQFIHASSGSGKVIITSLSSSYFTTRFYSARRVVG